MAILEEIFNQSLEEFFRLEADNIVNGVSERNLCARLAVILEKFTREHKKYKNYFADTEYNRKQNGEIKTIFKGKSKVVKITCDLILHSRGKSIKSDNLIAIEMKKNGQSKSSKNEDRARLSALTKSTYGDGLWSNDGKAHPEHVCGYKFGYFIEINEAQRSYSVEKFVGGDSLSVTVGIF